mmetsp:Transcript_48701/g.115947  ORF Transcript_48701/g.115947 Transcript_48701/m.115947 type:complete len:336 (-) Transcript_48701:360-1367(-)
MLHDDEHLRVGGHEVHGSSHALDHLPRNDPVGEVPVSRHLHGAQDGDIHLGPPDHTKGLRGGEQRGARQHGDGLLARVDDVRVHLTLFRIWSNAQQPVLALQLDPHSGLQVVADKRGHADAQVDIHAILQLFGCAPNDELSSLVHLDLTARGDRPLLDALLVALALHNSVHVDAGQMNFLRAQAAQRNNLLDLCNAHLASPSAIWIEVLRGPLPHEVPALIGLPSLYKGKVSNDCLLHDVAFAIEVPLFPGLAHDLDSSSLGAAGAVLDDVAAFVDGCPIGSSGEEGRDASTTCPQALCQGALRCQFNLQLTAEVQLLEELVLADVGRNHALDLP